MTVHRRKPVSSSDSGSSDASGSREVESVYKRQNPVFIMVGFVVSLVAVLYFLFLFYQINQNTKLNQSVLREQAQVQGTHARQMELNRGTKDKWRLYAEQRANVTQRLLEARKKLPEDQSASLLVFGAGNLNDLQMNELLNTTLTDSGAASPESYSSIALVDLDENAMIEGLERQFKYHKLDRRVQPLIKLYSGDITNSYLVFNEWKKEAIRHKAFAPKKSGRKQDVHASHEAAPFPTEQMIEDWRKTIVVLPSGLAPSDSSEGDSDASSDNSKKEDKQPFIFPRMKGLPQLDENGNRIQYDVVSSVCILSQLLDMYMTVVEEKHPSFLAGALTVRDQHLGLMLDYIRPGGFGVLVTDIVASSSFEKLKDTTHENLPYLLGELIAQSNFFTGCNPQAIASKLVSLYADYIVPNSVAMMPPHKWTIGGPTNKQYLVYTIVFQKKL